MKNLLLGFFAVLAYLSTCQEMFTLVKHPQNRGAACLDGSPAGLYYHEGKGANKNKYIMYFDSGGYCGDGSLA